MNLDRHARLRQVFLQAVELPESSRAPFLEEACGGDCELRQEVESLLANHDTQTIFETATARRLPDLPETESLPPVRFQRANPAAPKFLLNILLGNRTRRLSAILAAAALVVFLGLYSHSAIQDSLRTNTKANLRAVLRSQVNTMIRWINQTEQQAEAWAEDDRVRAAVLSLLDNQTSAEPGETELAERQQLANLLSPFVKEFGNAGVLVIGREGQILFVSDRESYDLELNAEALQRLEPVWDGETRFYRPYPAGSWSASRLPFDRPFIWIVAPVTRPDNSDEVVAALGLVRWGDEDFSNILKVIRIGESGECYAFDETGLMLSHSQFDDDLVRIGLLGDFPRRQSSMLNLRIANPGRNLLRFPLQEDETLEGWELTEIVAAATDSSLRQQGGPILEGVLELPYRDYRGVDVLGAWAWLPEFQFGIATEIDRAEADQPLTYLRVTFGILLLAVAVSAAGTIVSWFRVVDLQSQVSEADRVGQYTLGPMIGEGGMGRVYLAHHDYLKRRTAVKLIKPEVMSKKIVARFEREVQLASQLSHPNTIEIYDYGETDDGVFFYAMEYLDGRTLHRLVVDEGAIEPLRVIHILKQVCGSLREAHEARVVHRDIKPQNIMLCHRGGVFDVAKVLDFGLVKPMESTPGTEITDLNQVVGTPSYLPPERIRQPALLDPRSDLYAVGAVAYFLVTGTAPFEGENYVEIIGKVLQDDPRPVGELTKAEIPEVLQDVIRRCLSKKLEDRPQSAAEIQSLLESHAPIWTQEKAEMAWRAAQAASQVDQALVKRAKGDTVAEPTPRNTRFL